MSLEDLVEVDEQLVTSQALSDQEIIDSVMNTIEETMEEAEEDDQPEPKPIPTTVQAIESLNVAMRYFESHDRPGFGDCAKQLYKMIDVADQNSIMKQKSLSDYYSIAKSKSKDSGAGTKVALS